LGGSQAAGYASPNSDIDLYVYHRQELPVDVRAELVRACAEQMEIDNQFWEPGDEWIEAKSHIAVDVILRTPQWIEEQLDRVLVRYEASVGYSTCFWYNVLNSQTLYDRNGWYHSLQEHAQQPYPEPLRRAIIGKNFPVLRQTISSFLHQTEKAVARNDPVSINHRVANLLASYFDVLFAVNRLPHPGEKRLIEIAETRCAQRPAGMSQRIESVLRASATVSHKVVARADLLVDGLEQLLRDEGLLP
jgi:hypothetical protein